MIFCVEDDADIRELMLYALHSAGFEAAGFSGAREFFEALKTQQPQLVLLDIMLPDEDGVQILRKLRQNPATASLPVIMATAKGAEYDKVLFLDGGADDYLTKPFGMLEMVSRVKAVLRRSAPKSEEKTIKYGLLELDPGRHTALSDGQPVSLTLKEFELLQLLMENPGLVFSRDRLLARLWGADYSGETRTVDVHIGTLRTKLGPCGSYIETVRGVGYRMNKKDSREGDFL